MLPSRKRLPPALAASATPRILELLPPPARVLELGFAGIHAQPLRLAGYAVTVVEPDPRHAVRARERAGEVLAEVPDEPFDAAVAPEGTVPPPVRVLVLVGHDGRVWRSSSSSAGPTSSAGRSSPT